MTTKIKFLGVAAFEFCRLVRSLDTTGRRQAIALAPGESLVIDGTSCTKELA